jgi:hypothetical protein
MAAFRDLLKDTVEEPEMEPNGLVVSGTFAG